MDFIGIFSTRQSERRQCLIVVLKGEAYAGSDLPIDIHLIVQHGSNIPVNV